MKRLLLPSIAAFLAASLIAGYFFLPAYLERRTQLNNTFTAFEHLQASVDAGAGLLEYKHRLVETTAAMERMQQLDRSFLDSEIGAQLSLAWGHYRLGPDYQDLGDRHAKIRGASAKQTVMKYSEVQLHPPEASDIKTYRDSIRFRIATPSEALPFLEPWARASDICDAMLQRAAGHLSNAQIHAARKDGELYVPPLPRQETEWSKLLPIEHPARAKDLEARNAAIRAAAIAAAEAHRRISPLHVDLKALYHARGTLIWIDGKKWEYDFSPGHEEHIHANESVEIESFYANSIPLSVSVNGKPWDVRQWAWVEDSRYARKRTAINVRQLDGRENAIVKAAQKDDL